MSSTPRTYQARHLQLARAAAALLAALMITFTQDHSAPTALATFSGFTIFTALILFLAAWLVRPALPKSQTVLLAIPMLLAGMATGIPALRTTTLFFSVVIPWAFVVGIIELVIGLHARRVAVTEQQRSDARDAWLVGAVGILLGIALLLVPAGYRLRYFVAEAHESFTLTGITIGVGIFGFYAAIVAIFLAIAAFSPRRDEVPSASRSVTADAASDDHTGGVA